jgi:dTDP-glucose 4,6-dehydratase
MPLMICNTLKGKPLPVYGDGSNVRDWLHVADHCRGLAMVLIHGIPGKTYLIGGRCEMRNIDVVHAIIETVRELAPEKIPITAEKLITYIKDRPGHDRRYAINSARIESELGWHPQETFATGLRKTVQWYLDHADWIRRIEDSTYLSEKNGSTT